MNLSFREQPQVAICKTPFVQKDGDYQLMVMHKQQKAGLTYYLQIIVYKTMAILPLTLRKLLFPLSTPATTSGWMVISAIVVRTAASGHLHRTPQLSLTTCTSTLRVWYLRLATLRYTALLSVVSGGRCF